MIATGEVYSVKTFCEIAFEEAGIPIRWEGEGITEKGIRQDNGAVVIEVDPLHFRPAEVEFLQGDPSKAMQQLGWNPRKTSFQDLVKIMVQHDLKIV